jgi:cobalt-zinc-cadmium efflux system protein
VNAAAFFVLHGGDRTSLNLRGALLHVIGDLLGSAAAIVAALVILTTGWYPADPLLSMLVAVLLLRSAWRLVRESALILLEGAPPHIDRNAIVHELMESVAGIADIHHMHVWSLDGRQLMATLHARIAPGVDADAAIAALKRRLAERHSIGHTTVEIETGDDCPDRSRTGRRNGTA